MALRYGMPSVTVQFRYLELKSKAKLNLALGQGCAVNSSAAAPVDSHIRPAEVGSVEEVEDFSPKLKFHVLSYRYIFDNREVEIVQAGLDYGIASHGAQGVSWRRAKGCTAGCTA